MSQPHLVNSNAKKRATSVGELLALLGPEHLDRIENRLRVMRNSFDCPLTVRDHDDYIKQLLRFYQHYETVMFNFPADPTPYRNIALEDLKRYYKGDLYDGERDAIKGRQGGFIFIIDKILNGMIELHIESYLDNVLFENMPRDSDLQLHLAQELIRRYGSILFPDEELLHPFILAVNIDRVLKAFAMQIHAVRKQWRY